MSFKLIRISTVVEISGRKGIQTDQTKPKKP
jgi:hypothetical protein